MTATGKSRIARCNVEVDQSGKIERTQVDTVLAFSDGQGRAIRIPAAVKQRALHFLRRKPQHSRNKKAMYIRLFTAGLYLLLKEHLNLLDNIIIDIEYTGGEADINGVLLPLIWRSNPQYASTRIVFRQIGKRSPAHILAWTVHRGRRPADHVVTEEEFLALL